MLAAVKEVIVDITYLQVVTSLLVPLLVGAVTTTRLSSGWKAWINLGLSTVAGIATSAIAHEGHIILDAAFMSAIMTWLLSNTSYNHLWTKIKVAQKVQSSTENFGIGPKANAQHGDEEINSPNAGRYNVKDKMNESGKPILEGTVFLGEDPIPVTTTGEKNAIWEEVHNG